MPGSRRGREHPRGLAYIMLLGSSHAHLHALSNMAPRLPLCRRIAMSAQGRDSSSIPVKAKQSLGQNFLADESVAQRIVAGLRDTSEGGSRVLELGPGKGALTQWLYERYPQMSAIEIDDRLLPELWARFPTLSLKHGDLLEVDLSTVARQRGGPLSIISNTPFYLSSNLLFKLLATPESVNEAVLTTQLELADKLLAPHGTKEYGILSVMLQILGSPERLFNIEPEAFTPAPKCHVSVLRVSPSDTVAGTGLVLSSAQRRQLLGLIKLAFEQRRKMLRVSLKPMLKQARTRPPDDLLAMRPEQLAPADFVELAALLFGEGAEGGGDQVLKASHKAKTWQPHKTGYNS